MYMSAARRLHSPYVFDVEDPHTGLISRAYAAGSSPAAGLLFLQEDLQRTGSMKRPRGSGRPAKRRPPTERELSILSNLAQMERAKGLPLPKNVNVLHHAVYALLYRIEQLNPDKAAHARYVLQVIAAQEPLSQTIMEQQWKTKDVGGLLACEPTMTVQLRALATGGILVCGHLIDIVRIHNETIAEYFDENPPPASSKKDPEVWPDEMQTWLDLHADKLMGRLTIYKCPCNHRPVAGTISLNDLTINKDNIGG